ncbi:CaiB/BaiF CoA-transferase family protein [Streptomyces sp. WMMB 322]|uniref:CaiB/BaiF CoA transferase family protein n=1 Tax=Streptomyces sp. WMMB 322 TaxID=1286821 RepID=UPI0006E39E72|nr:CaiB/BaiF CoA-transferase family protein [Streptomyces sp. WMMB 322]SCK57297.1 Crotonobetainyl-CoA:carnitine CoA-transferase CaiB [Streptomyces sp. WMMB 322]
MTAHAASHGGLPLDGLTVVAVEQAVAAPYATRRLADLGARVIKVERPDGGDFARGYDQVVGGESSAFLWLNRGKESVQLDLKDPAAVEDLHLLLERADVVVANLAPAALGRLGLDAASLRQRHPGLIVCLISGYAPGGPLASKKAYDALIQAETGVMSLTGTPQAPAKVGVSIADIAAGSHALSGVLAAVRHRDRTGEALPVQVSLFDALTEWMAHPLYYTLHSGNAPVPMGTSHPAIAPYGAFTAADGDSLLISVQNEREWVRLCTDVLDAPALAGDDRFVSNTARVAERTALDAELADRFAAHTSRTLTARLDAAGIAWGRMTSLTDLPSHPELARDGRWMDTGTPGGTVRTLRPTGMPGGRTAEGGAVPALGAHTASVLAELHAAKGES